MIKFTVYISSSTAASFMVGFASLDWKQQCYPQIYRGSSCKENNEAPHINNALSPLAAFMLFLQKL
jgi:hypothetical protein